MPIAFHHVMRSVSDRVAEGRKELDQDSVGVRLTVRLDCSNNLSGKTVKGLLFHNWPRRRRRSRELRIKRNKGGGLWLSVALPSLWFSGFVPVAPCLLPLSRPSFFLNFADGLGQVRVQVGDGVQVHRVYWPCLPYHCSLPFFFTRRLISAVAHASQHESRPLVAGSFKAATPRARIANTIARMVTSGVGRPRPSSNHARSCDTSSSVRRRSRAASSGASETSLTFLPRFSRYSIAALC